MNRRSDDNGWEENSVNVCVVMAHARSRAGKITVAGYAHKLTGAYIPILCRNLRFSHFLYPYQFIVSLFIILE